MAGKATYVAAAATTQIQNGACVLERIIIGETAAGAITIYDNTGSDVTSTVGVLKASIAEGVYDFGIHLKNGCKVVSAANTKFTVVVS